MKPIPGKDARWLGYCQNCKKSTSFASRGGLKIGGIEHCYECGHEQETVGIEEEDIKRRISASRSHWKKYAIIPYNWHELSEQEKWNVLGVNNE